MYNSCHPVYMKYGLIKMDGIFWVVKFRNNLLYQCK
jgi:hypothetical protein